MFLATASNPHSLAAKPHIFEMFYSAANKIADSRRSLGIGLSVCNTIIRAHGGRMTAYNRPKGGAAVEFTLPLEDETV